MAKKIVTPRRTTAPQGATAPTILTIEQEADNLAATIFQTVEAWGAQVDRMKRRSDETPFDLARVANTVNRLDHVVRFKLDPRVQKIVDLLGNAAGELDLIEGRFDELASQFFAVKNVKDHTDNLCEAGYTLALEHSCSAVRQSEIIHKALIDFRAGGLA